MSKKAILDSFSMREILNELFKRGSDPRITDLFEELVPGVKDEWLRISAERDAMLALIEAVLDPAGTSPIRDRL